MRRKLENSCWRRSHAPPVRKLKPQLEWPPRALFCLKIPVVMHATAVATIATLSSNSCKSTIVFDTFYFRSAETVRREHVS